MALEKIMAHHAANPAKSTTIVFLADYVGRGPGAREVLDQMVEQKRLGLSYADGIKRVFLRGNHDHIFQRFIDSNLSHEMSRSAYAMLRHGGPNTLASYGVELKVGPLQKEENLLQKVRQAQAELIMALPASHYMFLQGLENFYEDDRYIYVHATAEPYKPMKDQNPGILTGLEDDISRYLDFDRPPLPKPIVHGHFVVEKAYANGVQVSLDEGVYKTGKLCVGILKDGDEPEFMRIRTREPHFNPNRAPQISAWKPPHA